MLNRNTVLHGVAEPSNVSVMLIALSSIVLGTLSGPFIRLLLNGGIEPAWITSMRMIALMIVIWPVVFANKTMRVKVFSVSKKDLFWIGLSGLFLGAQLTAWSFSLKYTSIFGTSSIGCIQYMFTVLIAFVFLKEKPGKGAFFGFLLSLLGVIIIGWSDFKMSGDILGSVFAVLSAICSSVYFVIGRHVRKETSLTAYTVWVNTFATAFITIGAIFISEPFHALNLSNVAIFFALAICCLLLGHIGINYGLKFVTADVISMLTLSGPFFAALFAYIFFGESIKPDVLLGAIFIIAGITAYMLIQQREKKKLIENIRPGIQECTVSKEKHL